VLKETDREKFSDVHAREEAFFPGSENSLSYYRRWYADFPCDFDLHYFPFDTQERHYHI